MTDRQDIDALLVGALYGELDAGERARLDAHLSTHPEDRAALAALEQTRAQVRRGLAELPVAEPPPSLSALLLQEAASAAARTTRRGARATATAAEAEAADAGLWARFVTWVRPFALNPAYAGALALLLVAGTATALYVRTGGKVAEPEARLAETTESSAVPASPPAPPEGAAPLQLQRAEPAAAAPPADEYRVDLDGLAAENGDVEGAHEPARTAATRGGKGARAKSGRNTLGIEVEAKKSDGVDIKELDQDRSAQKKAAATVASDDDTLVPADEAGAAPTRKLAAPPPAPGMGGAGAAAGSGTPRQAEPKTPKQMDVKLAEWAATSHARLRKLVADGKCPEAGRVGADIKDRAPEYYAANVANDRAIRACKSYIDGQAKKKAAKDAKSRSQANTVDAAQAAPLTK